MDTAIIVLVMIVLIFAFAFGMFDFSHNTLILEDAFDSVRASNQNALLNLEDKYDDMEELTSYEMLEEWLASFVSNSTQFESVKINFVQMETDPPMYLVYVEGYDGKYAMVSKDAVMKYYSASTIVEEN